MLLFFLEFIFGWVHQSLSRYFTSVVVSSCPQGPFLTLVPGREHCFLFSFHVLSLVATLPPPFTPPRIAVLSPVCRPCSCWSLADLLANRTCFQYHPGRVAGYCSPGTIDYPRLSFFLSFQMLLHPPHLRKQQCL